MKKGWHGRVVDVLLVATLSAAVLSAFGIMNLLAHEDLAYQDLAAQVKQEVSVGLSEKRGLSGNLVDWASLSRSNPDLIAWLTVNGTCINYPVVQPGADKADAWYLSHDFWGNESSSGCPYLDKRSSASSTHRLVFGHRLGLAGGMFSELSRVYKQEAFDEVGNATWSTPGHEDEIFKPLCALRVDKGFPDIQVFSFEGDDALETWLRNLCSDASAVSSDADALISCTSRVLTLVTCSGPVSGGRERTVAVFVA